MHYACATSCFGLPTGATGGAACGVSGFGPDVGMLRVRLHLGVRWNLVGVWRFSGVITGLLSPTWVGWHDCLNWEGVWDINMD